MNVTNRTDRTDGTLADGMDPVLANPTRSRRELRHRGEEYLPTGVWIGFGVVLIFLVLWFFGIFNLSFERIATGIGLTLLALIYFRLGVIAKRK